MASRESLEEGSTMKQTEEERIAMKGQLANLRERCADLEEGRSKMEEEAAENALSRDRLLATISKLDARNKVLVKRQASQEEAFELERREKAEIEETLHTQVQQLEQQLRNQHSASMEKADPAHLGDGEDNNSDGRDDSQVIAQTTLICQLRTQLADISESQLSLTEMHAALVSQVHNLEHEVAERTAECYRLREENEGFEILLRERTLDGRMYMLDDESASGGEESDANDVTVTASSADHEDDSDADGREVQTTDKDKSSSRRRRNGANLAEELGNSPARAASPSSSHIPQEDVVNEAETRDSDRAVSDVNATVLTLKAEVKALTDANKALRLYCSKILDRILQSEDEEHVLVNVSGSVHRGSASNTAASGKYPIAISKGKQHSIPRIRRAVTPEIFVQADASLDMPASTTANDAKEHLLAPVPTRLLQQDPQLSPVLSSTPSRTENTSPSGRSLSGRTLRPLSIVAKKEEREKEAKKAETDQERRLRRGFSLDWRSFSGALRPNTETGSKPEAASPSESATNPFLSIPHSHSQDRKLDISEEDEEDRVERERLLTTLKLMGVENSKNDARLVLPPTSNASPPKTANTAARPSPSTTFSRFSAFFARPTSPNDIAASAAVTESSQPDAATEPARPREESRRKRSSVMLVSTLNTADDETPRLDLERPTFNSTGEPERRTLSAAEASDVFNNGNLTNTPHHRTKGGETSLSTLWSLGSEGRDM